jgi:hypothetical protein
VKTDVFGAEYLAKASPFVKSEVCESRVERHLVGVGRGLTVRGKLDGRFDIHGEIRERYLRKAFEVLPFLRLVSARATLADLHGDQIPEERWADLVGGLPENVFDPQVLARMKSSLE